jgi:DNA adenine methylase
MALVAELLRSIKERAIVSVNDIPEMREVLAGLTMRRLTIKYSVGGGKKGRTEKGELLIRNW